ncbi:MAG: hypothetical protein IPG93_10945 [Burkholderiales bacterium]|nr:hypothetical protein [Burkholderiales bacterium]
MAELLAWNDLNEAAAWLAARTGEEWTPRRVLDRLLYVEKQEIHRRTQRAAADDLPRNRWPVPNPLTSLFATPPPDCRFISHAYPWPEAPSGAQWPTTLHWRVVPLRLADVGQLFVSGAVLLSHATDRSEEVNEKGFPLYAEEMQPPARISLSDVRLRAADVFKLAASIDAAPPPDLAMAPGRAAAVHQAEHPDRNQGSPKASSIGDKRRKHNKTAAEVLARHAELKGDGKGAHTERLAAELGIGKRGVQTIVKKATAAESAASRSNSPAVPFGVFQLASAGRRRST